MMRFKFTIEIFTDDHHDEIFVGNHRNGEEIHSEGPLKQVIRHGKMPIALKRLHIRTSGYWFWLGRHVVGVNRDRLGFRVKGGMTYENAWGKAPELMNR